MTNRFSALVLAALLAIALAACSAPAETPAASEPTEDAEASESVAPESDAPPSEAAADGERVRIVNSAFEPEELTVAVGTEVVFENADGFEHTVTEGTDGQAVDNPIVDEEIAQNGTVSVPFHEPGTYDITCVIHPSMQMTVTVEG